MGVKSESLSSLTTLWFLISAPLVLWDAGYIFMRPRSFPGGDLQWIWKYYPLYAEIDHMYGIQGYDLKSGFPNAQASMSMVEVVLHLYYVYLQHSVGSPIAPLVGFTGAALTLAKTMLYFAQEAYCGFCSVGPDRVAQFMFFFVVLNGFWILFPAIIVIKQGKEIINRLHYADLRAAADKLKSN